MWWFVVLQWRVCVGSALCFECEMELIREFLIGKLMFCWCFGKNCCLDFKTGKFNAVDCNKATESLTRSVLKQWKV